MKMFSVDGRTVVVSIFKFFMLFDNLLKGINVIELTESIFGDFVVSTLLVSDWLMVALCKYNDVMDSLSWRSCPPGKLSGEIDASVTVMTSGNSYSFCILFLSVELPYSLLIVVTGILGGMFNCNQ